MALGEKIEFARLAMGLTQKEFAKHIGVKGPTVSRWESNQHDPDPAQMLKILEVTGRPLEWFREITAGLSGSELEGIRKVLEEKAPLPIAAPNLTPMEQQLLMWFNKCRPERRQHLINNVIGLIKADLEINSLDYVRKPNSTSKPDEGTGSDS